MVANVQVSSLDPGRASRRPRRNDSPYADPHVASAYNRVAAPLQFGPPARDLVRLLRLPDGARVLDVGTGTGAVALQAGAEVGPTGVVIGIDAAMAMLCFARTTAPHRIALARIPGLPFPDAVFDIVTAGFVISHLADYGHGLAEMVGVCRSGGRLGITSWGDMPNAAARLWSEIAGRYVPSERLDEAYRAQIPWHDWFSCLANVERALRDADLVSVTVETREYRFTLATSDYLLSSEASVQGVALRRACPPDRWTEFTRRVADAFQSRFGDTVEYVRNVHFGIGTKRFAAEVSHEYRRPSNAV